MDKYTKDKLELWNLSQFEERFAHAGIDQEIFDSIDDDMLTNLFDPKKECGYMKKFKTRLNEMNAQKENVPCSFPTSPSNNNDQIHAQKENNSLSQPSIHNTTQTIIAVGHSHTLVDVVNLPTVTTPHMNIVPLDSDASFSSVSSESSSLNCQGPWEPRVDNVTPYPKHKFKDLLDHTYRGYKIRKSIEKGILETRMICELIVDQEIEKTRQFRISRERFNELLDDLVNHLVVEGKTKAQIKAIFYHVYKRATKTKKAVNTGGCVYDKYLTERKWLIRRDVITKDQILQEDLAATLAEEVLKFLRETDDPPEKVIEKWDETVLIRSPENDYRDYFLLYKGLRLPSLGHLLWSRDYDSMHENCPDFKAVFQVLTPIIIRIAKKKKKILPDDTALIDTDKKYIVALRCLVRILTKIFTKRDPEGKLLNKYGAKPTEIQNSFFYHASSITEFEKFKKTRKENSEEDKRPIGPFVTFIGDLFRDGLANVEGTSEISVYVTVNFIDFKIESNSVLDAIDYCYKSFTSLNIPYPIECHMVWIFLQRKVYKNNLEGNQEGYINVNKLIDLVDEQM